MSVWFQSNNNPKGKIYTTYLTQTTAVYPLTRHLCSMFQWKKLLRKFFFILRSTDCLSYVRLITTAMKASQPNQHLILDLPKYIKKCLKYEIYSTVRSRYYITGPNDIHILGEILEQGILYLCRNKRKK